MPTAWTLYFASDDAAATCAALAAAGGTVIAPPMQVGDFGTMAIATDPTGAVFGVWQADTMTGFDLVGEPGGFAWCDLRSTDPAAAQDFYGTLFGYSLAPVEMAPPDYATFALPGGAPLGGIGPMMGLPDGVPPHWVVYFAVAEADAAAAATAAHGGIVHAGPFDSPFGRMVAVSDPFGASLWLVELPAA
jgi:predicted enzyme related to lactoylglutathione lyase